MSEEDTSGLRRWPKLALSAWDSVSHSRMTVLIILKKSIFVSKVLSMSETFFSKYTKHHIQNGDLIWKKNIKLFEIQNKLPLFENNYFENHNQN